MSTYLNFKLFLGPNVRPINYTHFIDSDDWAITASEAQTLIDAGYEFHIHLTGENLSRLLLAVRTSTEGDDLFHEETPDIDYDSLAGPVDSLVRRAYEHYDHELHPICGCTTTAAQDAFLAAPFVPFDTEGRD